MFNISGKSSKSTVHPYTLFKSERAHNAPRPNARNSVESEYRPPGFKSDILGGNSLPPRAATSRVIAYHCGLLRRSYTQTALTYELYYTLCIGDCQLFFENFFVKNADFKFVHKLPLSPVFMGVSGDFKALSLWCFNGLKQLQTPEKVYLIVDREFNMNNNVIYKPETYLIFRTPDKNSGQRLNLYPQNCFIKLLPMMHLISL